MTGGGESVRSQTVSQRGVARLIGCQGSLTTTAKSGSRPMMRARKERSRFLRVDLFSPFLRRIRVPKYCSTFNSLLQLLGGGKESLRVAHC